MSEKLQVTNEHILFLSSLIHLLEHQFRWQDGATELRAYRNKLLKSMGGA
jgi:hypothetical protein